MMKDYQLASKLFIVTFSPPEVGPSGIDYTIQGTWSEVHPPSGAVPQHGVLQHIYLVRNGVKIDATNHVHSTEAAQVFASLTAASTKFQIIGSANNYSVELL